MGVEAGGESTSSSTPALSTATTRRREVSLSRHTLPRHLVGLVMTVTAVADYDQGEWQLTCNVMLPFRAVGSF